jgi:hypothetical protein
LTCGKQIMLALADFCYRRGEGYQLIALDCVNHPTDNQIEVVRTTEYRAWRRMGPNVLKFRRQRGEIE